MTHPTLVDSYLDRILLPELALCTLSPAQQKILALDVRDRLNSLLAHWGDVAFRRAVLLIGLEEASFYEPAAADLEVRALVNVAIRNSLLEDLAASNASMPELTFPRPIITDVGMAVLTETAVEFFQKMGLTNIAPLAPGRPMCLASSRKIIAAPGSFCGSWRMVQVLRSRTGCPTHPSPSCHR